MKNNFTAFKVGTVFNAYTVRDRPKLTSEKVQIQYPSRLEAMALNPAEIAKNNNLVYEAGQIDFCVAIMKRITVKANFDSSEISIHAPGSRHSLIRHAALIMREAFQFTHGLDITVKEDLVIKHCGLGSSSSLVAGVAAAINEMYGSVMKPQTIVRYCAQNHGEEIEGDDEHLIPVQCIGGSAVCGNYRGNLIILSGQAVPIFQHTLSDDYRVVIGIPGDFQPRDSAGLMQDETENLVGFIKTGREYAETIGYRLIHEVLPGLVEDKLDACKRLIFDYRWNMGSINNCSFVYPKMIEIAENLRQYENDERVQIISLSSVGPGFFIVCHKEDTDYCRGVFEENNLTTYETRLWSDTYHAKVLG